MFRYKNYKLYKTNPILSGNMKMDIIIDSVGKQRDGVFDAQIIGYQLSPISDLVSHSNIQKENILVRNHELNIKNFFDSHKEYFYKPVIDPLLESDWFYPAPKNMNSVSKDLLKTWDDTYWCGAKRILSYNKYNAQTEIFCPLWLEKCEDIKFDIEIRNHNGSAHKKFELVLGDKKSHVHNTFAEYIFNYLTNAGIKNGSDKCINIDFNTGKTTIYGLDVNSARFTSREDRNLIKNLTSRERFLAEANSNILQLYPLHHLICPNILNFNLVLKDKLLGNTNESFNISVGCSCKINGDWVVLNDADFYTNHEYVPQIDLTKSSHSETYNPNVLDHLHDNEVVDLIHYNKINQYVTHWCYTGNKHLLFNVYNGFNNHINTYENLDVYNGTNDIDKANWFGHIQKINTKSNLEDVFTNTEEYMSIFKDASQFIGTTEFNRKESSRKIYISVCTTKPIGIFIPNMFIPETNKVEQINILYGKIDKDGKDTLPTIKQFVSGCPECEKRTIDFRYQQFKNGDAFNTYKTNFGFNKDSLPVPRDERSETQFLTVFFWEVDNNLMVLFFSPSYKDNKVGKSGKKIARIPLYKGGALKIQNIIPAIREYFELYKNTLKTDHNQLYLYLNEFITTCIDNIKHSHYIKLSKTIGSKIDNTLGGNAKERVPYKVDNINDYVFRNSGNIKPALYCVGDKVHHINSYGQNYFWQKRLYNENDTHFLYKNLPPKYPSVGFDSVVSYENKILTYESPEYIFKDNYMEKWLDFKWFNNSTIYKLPSDKTLTIEVGENEDIKSSVYNKIYGLIFQSDKNKSYYIEQLKKVYKVDYDFTEMKKVENTIKYVYKIKAKLI